MLVLAKLCVSAAIGAASLLPMSAIASAQTGRQHQAESAAKSCIDWKVAGKWLSVASNNYDTTLVISQHGTKLSGLASIPLSEAVDSHYSTGTFTGTETGKHFRIVVIWAPRSTDGVQLHGLYTGTVVSGHIVKGLATDLTTKPTPSPASWVGYGPTTCLKY
jgi:hypothetical protein